MVYVHQTFFIEKILSDHVSRGLGIFGDFVVVSGSLKSHERLYFDCNGLRDL